MIKPFAEVEIPLQTCSRSGPWRLSKLLEKFVLEQLSTLCFSISIIPDDQFGFLCGRSVERQLLQCMENWHTALDANHCVSAVFTDASKAFDRVYHDTLLTFIACAGVQQSSLDWFQSDLSGRTICTCVLDAYALSPGQLAQSPQEYPKDLFWHLSYFFISKTFLPQRILSQSSLPTT